MKSAKLLIFALLFGALAAIGCSHGASIPTLPEVDHQPPEASAQAANHRITALYTFVCDPATGAIDVIPLREPQFHLNALNLLEPPLLVYLTLESIPKFNGNIVDVDIGLRNPYIGQKEFTGFDVCGIVFTHGSLTGFSDPDIVMAGEGNTRLLNADGFTRWWNPNEFPHGNTIFNYKDGLLGNPAGGADFNCQVNGYKYFADGLGKDDPLTTIDPAMRGTFSAGAKIIRHYKLDLSGGLVFNYAVDACWAPPQGEPPYIVPDAFPPKANRPEAWNVSITEIENYLYYENNTGCAGGYLKLQIDVWDHFDAPSNKVFAESPMGIPLTSALNPVSGGEGYSTYNIDIAGENLEQSGSVDLFITVDTGLSGYGGALPGENVCAYFKHPLDIKKGWARTWGGGFLDYGLDVSVDDSGNIYTVGIFCGTVDFNPGLGFDYHSSPSPLSFGVSLTKFNSCGIYQWTRDWKGPSLAIMGTPPHIRVATDGDGNAYISGQFGGSVDFDPGPGVEEHTYDGYGYYLSKFDPEGIFQWVRTWGNGGEYWGVNLAVGVSNNIYVTNPIGASQYGNSVILRRFSPNGDQQWGAHWKSYRPLGVAVDAFDNSYVTGVFNGTVDFNPGDGVEEHTAETVLSSFLSKFDPDGNFLWVRTWGAPNDPVSTFYEGKYVSVDDIGNIYVAGMYHKTVDFDPGPGVDQRTSQGNSDVYISMFDPDGGFQGVTAWGVGAFDWPECLALADGYLYVATTEWHMVTSEMYFHLVKLNLAGAEQWACSGYGWSVDVADSGNIYLSGFFGGIPDFDPGPGTQYHTSKGINDIFLTMLPPDGNW